MKQHRFLIFTLATVSFANAQSPLAGLWEFDDNSNLGKASVGIDLTVNGTAPAWVASQTYGSTTLNGVITTVAGTANGFTATHNIGVNGGGTTKTNEYTFIFDVSRPNSNGWRTFWQSTLANNDDAEFFVRGSGGTLNSLGRGSSPGYTSGTLAAETWQRLVVSIDNSNFFRVYLDGSLMSGGARTAQTIDNASFGLDPSQVLLFRDNTATENLPLVIGMAGIYGGALTDAQVALLSTAGTAVHRFNPLVWTGANSSEWSTNVISGSKNWNLGASAEDFRFADTASFNDSATGTTVNIGNGDVTPSALLFDNATKSFSIIGSNGIAGTTTLVKNGDGALTLGTANSFTGASSLNAGTVTLANSAALQNSAVTIAAGASLGFNGITTATVAGLAGAGSVSLQNESSAAVALSVGGNNASTTFSGSLSGAGSLVKNGTGTLTLSGSNSHSGGITLANGALTIADGNSLGNGALNVTKNSTGTFLSLSNAGDVVIANDITLPSSAQRYDFVKTTGGSTEFSGTLSGGGADTVLRLTTSTAGDSTTIHRLTGSNSLEGTIQIWRGALEIDNPASAGNARVVLEANVSPQGDLRFSESMTFTNDIRLAWTGNVIGVADPTHKVTLSGDIDESGGARPLTKVGSGILEITGNATYTGATTVSAGTLLINGSLGSTATTTVNPGATIAGNASFNGALAVNGALSPGNSPGQIDMNAADLAMGSSSTALFELGGTTRGTGTGNYDSIIGIGTITLDGVWTVSLIDGFMPAANDIYDLFDAATVDATGFDVSTDLILPALGGGLAWDTGSFTISGQLSVIPEPAAALLGGLGLLALIRRRRSQALVFAGSREMTSVTCPMPLAEK